MVGVGNRQSCPQLVARLQEAQLRHLTRAQRHTEYKMILQEVPSAHSHRVIFRESLGPIRHDHLRFLAPRMVAESVLENWTISHLSHVVVEV